tara:strand:- start:1001 stop:1426 length:426 start_codon:yes stop_codon:yes gene_type:complete
MRLSELKKEIKEEIISILSEQTDDAKAAKASADQKKKQGKDIEKNTKALSAYNDELEKSIDLEKDLTKAMMKEDEEEPSTTQLKGASKDSIAVLARKLQQVSSELKSTANRWKKSEGSEKENLKNRLLTLTKIKKELESML